MWVRVVQTSAQCIGVWGTGTKYRGERGAHLEPRGTNCRLHVNDASGRGLEAPKL